MQVEKYNYPEGYYYDIRHFWARVKGDVVVMDMSEYATNSAVI